MSDTVTEFASERALAEPEPVLAPLREQQWVSEARTVRYQVRRVLWGARTRYEIQDTATGSTLAVRTTRPIADGDVLVLNLGGRSGLRPRPPGTAPRSEAAGPPATEIAVGQLDDPG